MPTRPTTDPTLDPTESLHHIPTNSPSSMQAIPFHSSLIRSVSDLSDTSYTDLMELERTRDGICSTSWASK